MPKLTGSDFIYNFMLNSIDPFNLKHTSKNSNWPVWF